MHFLKNFPPDFLKNKRQTCGNAFLKHVCTKYVTDKSVVHDGVKIADTVNCLAFMKK